MTVIGFVLIRWNSRIVAVYMVLNPLIKRSAGKNTVCKLLSKGPGNAAK